MKKHPFVCTVVFIISLFVTPQAAGQITEQIYQTDYRIDPEDKGKLCVAIDNISFFKNDEFSGNFIKGYTLPGFSLKPTLLFYPLKNIKIEGGVSALRFWGANKYPNFAYSDIASWKGEQFQRGFHVVPFFRVHFALTENFHAIIGNIYGAANHRLITPLYNPEMNLIADPESGLQLLYNSRLIDVDFWLNWESFIFELDKHQEAFTVGLSSQFKYNRAESAFHIYSPIQMVGQHRGGEIDDSPVPVQMMFNGVVGLGATWNANAGAFKKMDFGVDLAGYYLQKGSLTPFTKGFGVHTHASVDIGSFRVKGGHWHCRDFVTLFGNPFFGSVSTAKENFYFEKPGMVYLGGEYFKSLGKGYSLGVDMDIYQHLPVTVNTAEGSHKQESALSFSFGVYFRINPSFLIKKF